MVADGSREPGAGPSAVLTPSGALILVGVVAAVVGMSTGAANVLLGGLLLAAAGVVVARTTDGKTNSA